MSVSECVVCDPELLHINEFNMDLTQLNRKNGILKKFEVAGDRRNS